MSWKERVFEDLQRKAVSSLAEVRQPRPFRKLTRWLNIVKKERNFDISDPSRNFSSEEIKFVNLLCVLSGYEETPEADILKEALILRDTAIRKSRIRKFNVVNFYDLVIPKKK